MDKDIERIYREKLIEQKKRTIIARKEKKQIQDQLIEQLKKDLLVLDSESSENLEKDQVIKQQKIKIQQLTKKLTILENRYNALKNSKLGKITLKYWELKRRKH